MNDPNDPAIYFDRSVNYYLTMFALKPDYENGTLKIEIECVLNINDCHPNNPADFFDKLKGKTKQTPSADGLVHGMLLRARYATDARYGVYAFKADREMGDEAVKQWAEEFPATFVSWLRESGVKYHDALPKTLPS